MRGRTSCCASSAPAERDLRSCRGTGRTSAFAVPGFPWLDRAGSAATPELTYQDLISGMNSLKESVPSCARARMHASVCAHVCVLRACVNKCIQGMGISVSQVWSIRRTELESKRSMIICASVSAVGCPSFRSVSKHASSLTSIRPVSFLSYLIQRRTYCHRHAVHEACVRVKTLRQKRHVFVC